VTVGGLKAGRSKARESEAVAPVPEEHVNAILPHVSRQVGAMIQLKALTAARPGEVCGLRMCDVDTTGRVWTFAPPEHKNAYRGHKRMIFVGPQAQKILAPFLKTDLQALLFPAEAEAARRATRTLRRDIPRNQGHTPGSNRKRKPRKAPGLRYTVEACCKAIYAGCENAFGMPMEWWRAPKDEKPEQRTARLAKLREWRHDHCWHPHPLRHNAATRLRKEHGLDVARAVLGHR
jgi:integrase